MTTSASDASISHHLPDQPTTQPLAFSAHHHRIVPKKTSTPTLLCLNDIATAGSRTATTDLDLFLYLCLYSVLTYFRGWIKMQRKSDDVEANEGSVPGLCPSCSDSHELYTGRHCHDDATDHVMYRRNKAMVKELSVPPPGAVDLHFETQYAQSMWGQFTSCLWKMWWSYWRNPDYNLVRFFFTLLCALVVGTVFWKIGQTKSSSNDLRTTIGAMYAVVFFVGVNNAQTVQPVVATERTVFYRERAAGMYSSLPYAMAQVFVEIPYVFLQTTYYTLIVYAMVSFEWTTTKFFWLFFINFFSFLYFTYFGMMTLSLTPNEQIAAIFAAGFYLLFNIFSGFYIPRPKIPGWWVWYYWICPMAWTVYGCIVSQYHDVDNPIMVPGMETNPPLTSYVKDFYGFQMDFMGPIAAVLIGFCVFFAFLYATFLRTLNFQMR